MDEENQTKVKLREVQESDLERFFEHQLDQQANLMAAFTAKDPADREAFKAHWSRILSDESITIRTVLYKKQVAGHILCHTWFGEPEISYWLGREYWGKGIATSALVLFLELAGERPLYARCAKDNGASLRVLQKCGFKISGEDKGFSMARGQEVEEYILKIE